MARHGENIRKRKDGRWEGRYPVYNAEKGKQVYCSIYGRTYEDVREKLIVKKNLLKSQSNNKTISEQKTYISKDIIFTELALDWLAQVKKKRKQSTYQKYNMIYQKHIKKTFENVFLSEMTDSFVSERISDTLSDSVQKSIYCILNQILKHASTQYYFTIISLKKPVFKIHNKPVKILSKNEQKQLMTILYQEINLFKMAVLLVLFTGLRLGELCALKWTDIDFKNKLLTVNRTVQRLYVEGYKTKTVLIETTPKSEHSRREIPLPTILLELLVKFYNDKEYVFGGDKPMEPRTMQYQFKKILKEANLYDTNFHILRHTFSTNCIENGMDVKSLSEMLGHSDVQITLNRYVHPSMDTKRKYMDSLSTFYGQIYGQTG